MCVVYCEMQKIKMSSIILFPHQKKTPQNLEIPHPYQSVSMHMHICISKAKDVKGQQPVIICSIIMWGVRAQGWTTEMVRETSYIKYYIQMFLNGKDVHNFVLNITDFSSEELEGICPSYLSCQERLFYH